MIKDDEQYSNAINRIAEVTYIASVENGLSRDRQQALHDQIITLQETVELTADMFGVSVQQVEEDVIDAIDHLPIDDIYPAIALRHEGKLH